MMQCRYSLLVAALLTAPCCVMSQWQQTNGPFGGLVYALAASGVYFYRKREGSDVLVKKMILLQ